MSSSKFDIEYKKWLHQIDEEPDKSVWNNIRDELDFIETWDNIESELDKKLPTRQKNRKLVYIPAMAAAIAAIILMISGPFGLLQSPPDAPINHAPREFAQQLTDSMMVIDSTYIPRVETVPVVPENYFDASRSLAIGTERDLVTPRITPPEERISREVKAPFENEEMFIPESRRLKFKMDNQFSPADGRIQLTNKITNDLSEETITHSMPEIFEKEASFISLADIGMVYGYKNTWLINHETRNGLDPKKLGNTLVTFNRDMGISSTWAIKGKPFLGIEFLWNSATGQKYQQYIDARFVERDINLDYTRLQAMYIYDYARIPGQLLLGGYVARLNLGEETRGDVTFDVSQNYNKLDYGLLAGYQVNVNLHDRIVITPGIRGSYNLVNMFKGDGNVPDHFKTTKNFTTGFSFALSYRF